MFRYLHRSLFGLFMVVAIANPGPVSGQSSEATPVEALRALRLLDQRVEKVGYRLAVANLDLCRSHQWLPGFTVHDLSQYGVDGGSGVDYRAAAVRAFGLGEGPAVLALAPGGAAERAGLRLDDMLVAVDGHAPPHAVGNRRQGSAQYEQILDFLEAAFADGHADLQIRRGTEMLTIPVQAEQGCASRFQVVPGRSLNASADGRYVQIKVGLVVYVEDDAELAAVLAHEFAHNILGHRVRLDAEGVSRGFLGNFGGNARRIRATEEEADRLSVYLLERAGYDPEAAVRFWTRFGRHGFNPLGSPNHPNARSRIASFEEEIAVIRAARAAGRAPVPSFMRTGASQTGL